MFSKKIMQYLEDIILWVVIVIFSILLITKNKELIIIMPMLLLPLIFQVYNIFKGNKQMISNVEYTLCAIAFFSWFIANMISTGNLSGNFDKSINALFLIAGSIIIILLIIKNFRLYIGKNNNNIEAK